MVGVRRAYLHVDVGVLLLERRGECGGLRGLFQGCRVAKETEEVCHGEDEWGWEGLWEWR